MGRTNKVFELEEANALLPHLETLLSDLEEKQESFRKIQEGLFFEELVAAAPPPESKLQEMEEMLMRLEHELGKIRELGCILRHPERGLVDFLARRGDEWIYYCWRRGEMGIQFYHTLHGGFFERRPLETIRPER